MSAVSIREAQVADVPLIQRFILELAEFEKLSHEVDISEETLRESLFGERSYAYVIIAEIESEPVGFAVYFFNYSTFLGRQGMYIEDLYVLPDRRSEGVGKALFRYCVGVALEKQCGRLEFAVLHWNPARQFYERLGATPMDDWIMYRLTGSALEKAVKL